MFIAFIILLISMIILVPTGLQSKIIHVPEKSRTIREGIDQANDGDTLVVSPGTYHESRIDFQGRKIMVMSSDPTDSVVVAKTIVFGDSAGCVFYFRSGEDSTTILSGLTISGGKSEYGGGISCLYNSSPMITRNIITSNVAGRSGGGIYCENSSPRIRKNRIMTNRSILDAGGISCVLASYPILSGNTISGNVAGDYGGGINCTGISFPVIFGNTITANSARYGGAINCFEATATLSDNLITRNSATYGGGIYCSTFSRMTVINTTLSENEASYGREIMIGNGASPSTITISYSVVKGGVKSVNVEDGNSLEWGTGVITSDPRNVQFLKMQKVPQVSPGTDR